MSAGEGFVLLGDFNRQLDQPRDDFWAAIDDGRVCTWIPDSKPFPFPFNPRYPYAIDHIVMDAVTARGIVPGSYTVPDYEDDYPASSGHHPVAISLRLSFRP